MIIYFVAYFMCLWRICFAFTDKNIGVLLLRNYEPTISCFILQDNSEGRYQFVTVLSCHNQRTQLTDHHHLPLIFGWNLVNPTNPFLSCRHFFSLWFLIGFVFVSVEFIQHHWVTMHFFQVSFIILYHSFHKWSHIALSWAV